MSAAHLPEPQPPSQQPSLFKRFRRLALMGLGWIFLIAGIPIAILPIVHIVGIVMMVIGLIMILRQSFGARLNRSAVGSGASEDVWFGHDQLHLRALGAARRVVFSMRAQDDIGDDAFHRLEEEFDWIEMSIGRRGET